jgi:hypothetical protein
MGRRTQLRLLITGRRRVDTFEQRAQVAETMIPVAAFATFLRRIM